MSLHTLTDSELATITNALLIAADACADDAKGLNKNTAEWAAFTESSAKYAALANRIDGGETEVEPKRRCVREGIADAQTDARIREGFRKIRSVL